MMQSQTSDDAIPRNLIIFVGGLKPLVVTVLQENERAMICNHFCLSRYIWCKFYSLQSRAHSKHIFSANLLLNWLMQFVFQNVCSIFVKNVGKEQ